MSLTKNGFSLIIEAIVRNDKEYITEQIYGNDEEEGMVEESEDSEE